MGDSDSVANYIGNVPGNVEFFLRTVRWLARGEPAASDGADAAAGAVPGTIPIAQRLAAGLSGAMAPALITVAVLVARRRRMGRPSGPPTT